MCKGKSTFSYGINITYDVIRFCRTADEDTPNCEDQPGHVEIVEPIKNDQSYKVYEKALNEVKSVRKNHSAAFNNPLFWGILDLREIDTAPFPRTQRAEHFLPNVEHVRLRDFTHCVFLEAYKLGEPAQDFWNAILDSDITSVKMIGLKQRSRGVAGIAELIRAGTPTALASFREDDEDTSYIGECFSAASATRWLPHSFLPLNLI